jgi:predicted nucleic acid-binding protein
MAYLLDTCALSELVAKKPHRPAVEKILRLPREDIFLSTITIGEIQSEIDELQPCERKVFLQVWLEDHVLKLYSDRTIAVDIAVARVWGTLSANLIARGRTMQVKDSLIAATALVHGLTVVTRNEGDFAHSGVRVFTPWK